MVKRRDGSVRAGRLVGRASKDSILDEVIEWMITTLVASQRNALSVPNVSDRTGRAEEIAGC